jgi:hypothetical protein
MGMQFAVGAIEGGVASYYFITAVHRIYQRYEAGCAPGDLVTIWDVVDLIPALSYARVVGQLARAGKAPGKFLGKFLADESGSVRLPGGAGGGPKPYEVGRFDDLRSRSTVRDGLDIHHAPQKHPAEQVVTGYKRETAPAIALPKDEHASILNRRGDYNGSPRDLLAQDIRNLRDNTGAPNSALQELIELNKIMYREMRNKWP